MKLHSTRRVLILIVAIALLGGVSALGTGSVSAAPRQDADTWTRATSGLRLGRSSHPKLEPSLSPQPNDGSSRLTAARPDASGRVRVDVDGPDTAALQSAITDVGGAAFSVAPESIRADVPQAELGRLADDPRVEDVHAPHAPVPTSEGVQATNASAWQSNGRTGAGVKVAVVDLGFTGLAAQQTAGVVPASTTKSFCGDGSPSSLDGDTNHGVGVAEIVHEMAPNAALYLVCFDQDADLQPIVMYLASQGVTIVNASWGNPFARGDGSGGPGTSDAAVAAGRAAGQLWVVASGNEGDRHYNFQATDADSDSAVEFLHSGFPLPGPDEQEIYDFSLAAGDESVIALKWDAWPVTNQEFMVCVWFDAVRAENEVGCLGGGQSQHPSEPIIGASFVGLPGHFAYKLAILRVNATISPRMDLYFLGSEGALERTSSGSITAPASSPAAFAVGAHNFGFPGEAEPYSGDGPTIDGRTKPDISGPDGVSNAVFSPFRGTSAAAPHVTGAAALVKEIDPSLSPSQIQEFLERKAGDVGAPGPDNKFGFGSLDLGNPAMASGTGDPVGSLDPATPFAGGAAVSGIAFDPDTVVPSQVSVVVDGGQTVSGVAVTPRSDTVSRFANADGVFHGFAVSVALAPGVHQLCVSAVNAPSTVGVDTSLGCVSAMALAGGALGRRDVDFNGDGRADLAVMRPGSPADQWFALGLAGSTLFGDSGRGDVAVPADYNGDGRAEPAVFRPTSPGQWWISGRASPVIFGQPGDIPVVGDYNGDGRADVAVYRPGNPGQLFVNGFPNQPLLFGRASLGDIPAPGNYMVAGRTDFAVFRPGSPGQWFVNGLPGSTAFGEAGDIPVPADYNGDGRADFGVVRLSGPAMQWFMNGVGGVLFGDSRLGDIPMPADYNGDNRVDVAVVRPGAPTRWYLNGIGSTAFGQATDIPISGS